MQSDNHSRGPKQPKRSGEQASVIEEVGSPHLERWGALTRGDIQRGSHYETILWALAHIAHACERQNQQIASAYNLSGLELACLRLLLGEGPAPLDDLVRRSPLGQQTLDEVFGRLKARGLVEDRAGVNGDASSLALTKTGEEFARSSPPPIHERFARELAGLPEEEQSTIAASFRRVVELIEKDRSEGLD